MQFDFWGWLMPFWEIQVFVLSWYVNSLLKRQNHDIFL
jgi:hypothetical protein